MRVLFVGIDALDREFIDKHLGSLPTFARLIQGGSRIPLRSVFPPDSDTAWASVYTATDPATHGILNFTDALSKSADHAAKDVPNTALRGKTFWDFASAAGKRVCLIHPHIGYPPWSVNGLFIGRSSVGDEVEVMPPRTLPGGFDPARLILPRGFPDHRNLDHYVGQHERLVDAQRELSLALVGEEPWDLFYVYSSSIDMVKHFFWSFSDPEDPNYPGETRWQDVILNLYVQHDRWIGELIERAGDDVAVVIVGDHGHGRRPTKVVHLNELLRRRGWLVPRKGIKGPTARALDAAKGTAVKWIGKLHLENLASEALRRLPAARKVFTAPPSIDWDETLAYMSDLSGIKAYSYGGIRLRKGLDPSRKAALRAEIIEELREIREPGSERRLVDWVGTPEEIYGGPFLDRYPEILYLFVPDYGASTRVNTGLFGVSASQSLVPGTHRIDTPEFIVAGAAHAPRHGPARMMDVGATVLELLGLPQTIPSAAVPCVRVK